MGFFDAIPSMSFVLPLLGNLPPVSHSSSKLPMYATLVDRARLLNISMGTGCPMDAKHDQLETRVATLELMLVTERARPNPDSNELAKLEKDLKDGNRH
jgi:hypothetical protein